MDIQLIATRVARGVGTILTVALTLAAAISAFVLYVLGLGKLFGSVDAAVVVGVIAPAALTLAYYLGEMTE